MMRCRIVLLSLIFQLVLCSLTFSSTIPACRQRLISICQEDTAGAICRLLSQDAPETVESVSEFLQKIRQLDESLQQDLICARLMGRKKILNFQTTLSENKSGQGKYSFTSGISTWQFKMTDPAYEELVKKHRRLDQLKIRAPKEMEFDLEGIIVDVDATYSDGVLSAFTVDIEEPKLLRVETPFASGNFKNHIRPLTKIINEEYDRYMNLGMTETAKPATPVTAPKPRKPEIFTNSIGVAFVKVPSGMVIAGEIGQERKILIFRKPFYIGQFEVTQAQWQMVMGNNPSHFKGDTLPVENVSWNDVQNFIGNLNQIDAPNTYRLPTENEWEFACRARTQTAYCFGNDEGMLGEYAWYEANSGKTTHPVGQKKPNAWGIYDMHGNVYEWCQDLHGSGRVFRGGSWYYPAWNCRAAYRFRYPPDNRYIFLGFRLVLLPGQ